MKKKVALLLSIILCFSVFSTFSITAASDEVTYQVDGGSATTTSLSAAFTSAASLIDGQTATITLLKDVTISSTLVYTGAGKLIVDGNGFTCNTTMKDNWKFQFQMNGDGTLTLNNVKVVNSVSSVADTVHPGVVAMYKGTLEANNCSFNTPGHLFYFENAGDSSVVVNGGEYVTGYTGQGAFFRTLANANLSINQAITIDGATLVGYGVGAYALFYSGARAAGCSDTITISNSTISVPNISSNLFQVVSAESRVNITSSNIFLPRVINGNMFTVPGDVLTWDKINFLGGRMNGWLGNNLSLGNYASTNQNAVVLADGKDTAATLPALRAAASVRLDLDGVRFETFLSSAAITSYKNCALKLKSAENTAETVTLSYGTIVTLQERLDAYGITAENLKLGSDDTVYTDDGFYYLSKEFLDALNIKYLDIAADKGIEGDEATGITYRAAVTDITEGWYDTKLATIAYVKATVGEETFYFYSTFDPRQNTHNMKDVATQQLADYEAAPENYSYNPQDIARLKAYAGVTEG